MKSLVTIAFKGKKELKNKILDIVHSRKKAGEDNATFKDVASELLEKALSLNEI